MRSELSRRLLMLIHDFPPAVGGGILRPLKFATYLPEFGWTPVVLTIREADVGGRDAGLLEAVPPGTELHRTRTLIPPRRTAEWRARDAAARDAGPWLGRAARSWLRDLLLVPDSRVAWWPCALPKALEVYRKSGFAAIYATAPPYSSLVLGRTLKRLTGRPLVCDFRDPWSHELTETRAGERPFRRRAEIRQERAVVRGADAVVVTAPGLVDVFREAYPAEDPSKFHLVTNGYDPADYDGVEPMRFERFAIVYTGKVHEMYSPATLLDGLRLALERQPGLAERLEVHFLGEFDPALRGPLGDPPLSRVVTVHGHVSHRAAIAFQLGADLLVSMLADLEAWKHRMISAKVFEYLYAGAPVLGIMPPDGPSARLIREGRAGVIVAPGDAEGVAAALRDFVGRQGLGTRREEALAERATRREAMARYSRRELTEKLAGILEAVTQRRAG